MRALLLTLIALMVAGYDGFAIFAGWFTLAFFGPGGIQWLVAFGFLGTGAVVTMYGLDRWRKVSRRAPVRV